MARMDAASRSALPPRSKQRRRWAMAAVAVLVIGGAVGVRCMMGDAQAQAQTPSQAQREPASNNEPLRPAPPEHDVMAIVNGQDISRTALAAACVERFGEDVLESLVNKRLIEHHCRNRGVTITRAEIEQEIDDMAKRFKLGREQWLGLLEDERGVKPEEYKRDILWPTLALRKLAAKDLQVSDDELQKAYETRYGPAVQARLIVVESAELAERLHRQLTANPDDFARLAMQESVDVNSASIGGLIQPIRMHVGEPQLVRQAFALKPGQISSVVKVGDQFALLKCERHIPARSVNPQSVREQLQQGIKDDKLRVVAAELFKNLQSSATVKNIYNDPELRQSMPGVVATVNGQPITMQELGKEALARHGKEVLEGQIAHKLLEQQLNAQGVTVEQADLRAEIEHAAELAGTVNDAGEPDLKKWIKAATEDQGVTYETYVEDSVWPSAALKKLTRSGVTVTQEDMKKGYLANYGERVRVRAIVLGQMRRAQEVWDKARANPSIEYFGDLAAEYSVEPTSKSLRGEVPPLRQHGGQPQLEEVAFKLKPGELSGIVQVGDKFVILKCEGRTNPVDVNMQEVQKILHQDIYEKKLRVAMAQKFDEIRKSARVDNYLAGTSYSPPAKRDTAVRPTSGQQR